MHEPSSSALAAASGTSDHRHGDQAHHGHDGGDHVSIPRMALTVFVVLCLLTGTSLLTYTTYWQEHVPMAVGRAVMLAVSLTKAFLVVAFFMHLWWEVKWKYVVTFPAMTVSALLIVSLVPDIGMRTQQYDAARLLNAPEAMPYTVGPELKVAQPTTSAAAKDHSDDGHSEGRRSANGDSEEGQSEAPHSGAAHAPARESHEAVAPSDVH